ncbi:MAG: histidine kinase dimerization/phospho-acceptor domain-containing protein, partial [Cyanobacteria bacterium J06648_11]
MAWDIASKPNRLFRRSRWQLTAWYTGVMAVVLSLSGLGVYEAIAHAHRVIADRELKSVAETIHRTLETKLSASRWEETLPPNLLPIQCMSDERCLIPFELSQGQYGWKWLRGTYYMQVVAPSGELLATAGAYPEGLSEGNPDFDWQVLRDTQGNPYRQTAIPLYSSDRASRGTLLVGRSFSDFAAYLTTIRWIIVVSLPVTMLAIAIASWWLAGLAMQPVQVSYRNIQQFTADAAHELRTPLSAIGATTEAVARTPYISDRDARDTLQVIGRQNQRLANLV